MSKKVRIRERGFSIAELMATISIIGIISAISVPSFMAWRRQEVVNGVRNELLVSLSGISDEAKRWGATCTLMMLTTSSSRKPFSIDCRADGSLKAQEKCNRSTGCNISSSDSSINRIPEDTNGQNLVVITANQLNISFTPRGQLASGSDVILVIHRTPALGGEPPARCIVMKAITGEVRNGEYLGAIPPFGGGVGAVSTSLDASQCRQRV